MASTDTRSGFRLPWNSDRSHDEATSEVPGVAIAETPEASHAPADPAWPKSDFNAALGVAQTAQRPIARTESPLSAPEEPAPMVEMDHAVAAAPAAAPRKPSKLMVDLTAAIRATAESARIAALAQAETDLTQVVDAIRASSTDGASALKHQSDEDVASIREWSKAEIARVREETETRISARKETLEGELAGHAAAVERRVEEVKGEVGRFETAMAAYLERLSHEQDPARLATMAEEMPEAPSFEAWADLGDLDITLQESPAAESIVEPWLDGPAAEAIAEPVVEAPTAPVVEAPTAPVVEAPTAPEATAGTVVAAVMAAEATAGTALDPGGAPVANAGVVAVGDPVWNHETNAWMGAKTGIDEAAGAIPRWAAGETPEGFPTDGAEGGDPVDRGAIMAALEAAAEAVVAAEAAAESADQAEAAADVAETAAGLLVGRAGSDDDYDPEAQAAMSARVDAGGYQTESFQDRLASLLPGHGEGAVGDEARTTEVVVSGLVSVASIASFKRHLGRIAGVQNVAVASGPEGEFVFNLTHRADLSFRDAIPTMPGFAARVTSSGDGVVNVTARDPEAEG